MAPWTISQRYLSFLQETHCGKSARWVRSLPDVGFYSISAIFTVKTKLAAAGSRLLKTTIHLQNKSCDESDAAP